MLNKVSSNLGSRDLFSASAILSGSSGTRTKVSAFMTYPPGLISLPDSLEKTGSELRFR